MRRHGPTEGATQTKKVRFDLATDVPTTSRVGAPELSSRIGTWWMNPRMADVKFNVGPPDGVQELIPAHVLVVAPASEVFNAMFLGSFDVPPTIDVPDGDPDAFKEMLRYIYTDRAVVTIGSTPDILYLAKKYLLSGLIQQVVDYLKANISLNFSAIYNQAASLREEIREVCVEFIENHSHDLFLSDEFVELDFDVMRKVAVRSLAVDTLTFYRKLLGWAQEECQRRSVEASTTNMRCILADAFKLIRFVALSPEEFEQGPGRDELLTVHEKAVLRHWHEHGHFRSLVGQKPITTFRSFAAVPEFLLGSEGVCAITERQVIADAIENCPIEMAPVESKYKRYYDFIGDSAKCKKCKHSVSKSTGGSKGMRKHLQSQHKEVYEELVILEKDASDKQAIEKAELSQSMKNFVVSTPADTTTNSPADKQSKQQSVEKIYGNWSKNGLCTKAAHRALMQLVASANLPLSLVDDVAFRNFCNALQPLYHPPSRRTLSDEHIESLCTEYEEKVKEDLRQAKHISLTTDVGTTKNQKHSLVALTAHYVKPDGHLGHCYAGVVPLRVRHTGLAIASVIDDLVNYYDVREKVHVVLRDNGSNMIKAMEIYGVKSSDCFAHVLQNAVKDGLKHLGSMLGEDGTIERVKSVIRKIRKSGVEAERFKAFQEDEGLKAVVLQKAS